MQTRKIDNTGNLKACGNCFFWEAYSNDPERGACLHDPPTRAGEYAGSGWPTAGRGLWCGKWEANEIVQEMLTNIAIENIDREQARDAREGLERIDRIMEGAFSRRP